MSSGPTHPLPALTPVVCHTAAALPRLKDPKDPADIMGLGVPGRIFNHPLTVPPPPADVPSDQKKLH